MNYILITILLIMSGVIFWLYRKVKRLTNEKYSLEVHNRYLRDRVELFKEELARLG